MPLYEYRCRTCAKVMEDLFPVNTVPIIMECECGGVAHLVPSVCYAKFWRLDTEHFGTPEYTEARRRQCGVEI